MKSPAALTSFYREGRGKWHRYHSDEPEQLGGGSGSGLTVGAASHQPGDFNASRLAATTSAARAVGQSFPPFWP